MRQATATPCGSSVYTGTVGGMSIRMVHQSYTRGWAERVDVVCILGTTGTPQRISSWMKSEQTSGGIVGWRVIGPERGLSGGVSAPRMPRTRYFYGRFTQV